MSRKREWAPDTVTAVVITTAATRRSRFRLMSENSLVEIVSMSDKNATLPAR